MSLLLSAGSEKGVCLCMVSGSVLLQPHPDQCKASSNTCDGTCFIALSVEDNDLQLEAAVTA